MTLKVTGAHAVVELEDGNDEIGTGKRVYLDRGVLLPSNAKPAHVEHLKKVGLVTDEEDVTVEGAEAPAKPTTKAAAAKAAAEAS